MSVNYPEEVVIIQRKGDTAQISRVCPTSAPRKAAGRAAFRRLDHPGAIRRQPHVERAPRGASPRGPGRGAGLALVFRRPIRFDFRAPSDQVGARFPPGEPMRLSRYFLPILRETPKE